MAAPSTPSGQLEVGARADSPAMTRLTRVTRLGRAWAPAAKAAALFLLPVPLLFAVLTALIAGDLTGLAFAGGALACLWGAGALALRALVAEARYSLGEISHPPAMPLKLLSAAMTALGVALAAVAGGHTAASALVFAALGALGHVAFYGRDLRPRRIHVAVVEGIDSAAVTLQLEQAYGRLRGIESAARAIAVPEFRDRLSRITSIGRSVLGEIEHDPRDAGRARRFLNLYLDGAERVTVEYARTHRHVRNEPLEQNFRQLLVDIESRFAEQHRNLIEHDLLSLDVDIEVLNTRLKREGLG
jgi:5-bromo-4-chloroindolyl phosphate hydrolysis protein